MALINKVWLAWKRLRPHWSDYLKSASLDLTGATRDTFEEKLTSPVDVNFGLHGLEDFAREGRRGIEPGSPARSLFFHVLASPNVILNGLPDKNYPTPAEIEAVENYVYGVCPPSIQDLRVRTDAPLTIVVFAYEYRPAVETVHQKHADMCFSRTGICRVGSRPAKYDARARAFDPHAEKENHVRVLPCRYAAYFAAQYRGDKESFRPLRFQTAISGEVPAGVASDADLNFWVPLHKLFSGDECIRGRTIEVELKAHHRNEKIRRIHLALAAQGHPTQYHEDEMKDHPFVITQGLAEFSTRPENGNGLLVPVDHDPLIEPAMLGRRRLTFTVPGKNKPDSSSFRILPKKSGARSAPEFVHARHRIDATGALVDLNTTPNVAGIVRKGGYEAQHYVDYTADGFIEVTCKGLELDVPRTLAAYSLVAPPDFYPYAKQEDLMDWWEQSAPPDLASSIWPSNTGPPSPLSDQRYPGNLNLEGAGFDPSESTMSAIVGFLNEGLDEPTRIVPNIAPRVSSLPDHGAGVFAPGWDCSIDRTEEDNPEQDQVIVRPGITHLANYGLGSPFPEDGKLCAAESAFWPLAAPDITRCFEPQDSSTVTPLTDDLTGQQRGTQPWDGIRGPRWPGQSRREVEFNAADYGDWVKTALRKEFQYSRLIDMTAQEYEERTLVMARVYKALGATSPGEKNRWCVFSFSRARPNDKHFARAQRSAACRLDPAHSYRFIMFQHAGQGVSPKAFDKVQVKFKKIYRIFADLRSVLVHGTGGAWERLG
jgi:hypothetical protein